MRGKRSAHSTASTYSGQQLRHTWTQRQGQIEGFGWDVNSPEEEQPVVSVGRTPMPVAVELAGLAAITGNLSGGGKAKLPPAVGDCLRN